MRYCLYLFFSFILISSCVSDETPLVVKNIRVTTINSDHLEFISDIKYEFFYNGTLKYYKEFDTQDIANNGFIDEILTVDFLPSQNELDVVYKALYRGSAYLRSSTKLTESLPLSKSISAATYMGDTEKYDIEYEVINGQNYIAKVIEYSSIGDEGYRLNFDYSNFDNNQILVEQTRDGESIFKAKLQVQKISSDWVPDSQLFELYPLNKFRELIFSGYLGEFNYAINQIEMSGLENYIQKSTYKLARCGRPLTQIIERTVSDSILSYLNFKQILSFSYQMY